MSKNPLHDCSRYDYANDCAHVHCDLCECILRIEHTDNDHRCYDVIGGIRCEDDPDFARCDACVAKAKAA